MALDPNEISTRVRFLLGNPSESVLPEDLLLQIINDCILKIGSDDEFYCEVVQCSLLETLRYLIRKDQQPSAGGGGGALTKRREKRGKTEVEETYSSDSEGTIGGWQDMYDDYLEHPEWICESLAYVGAGKYLVNIGGVRQDQSANVLCDQNSRSAYDKPRVGRKFWKASSRPYYSRR